MMQVAISDTESSSPVLVVDKSYSFCKTDILHLLRSLFIQCEIGNNIKDMGKTEEFLL